MAILLVTYDLKQPGRNYQPVYDYLKQYNYCKSMESVWLLDTSRSTAIVRDHLRSIVDRSDVVFVTRLARSDWAAYGFGCDDWLSRPERTW